MLQSGKIASFAINLVRPYYTKGSRNNENSERKETQLNKKRIVRESRFQGRPARQK